MAQGKMLAAREPTEQDIELRREVCFELNEQVKRGLAAGRGALWQTAQALSEFDEADAWRVLGHETLSEWLADPEIGMSRSTYHRLVRCFRALQRRKLPEEDLIELDPSKVDVVLPALEKGKVPQEDALADVRALGWRDLRDKYMGPRPDSGAESSSGESDVSGGDLPDNPLNAWLALREELTGALASGAAQPRITAGVIGPGLAGLDALLEQAGISLEQGGGADDDARAA